MFATPAEWNIGVMCKKRSSGYRGLAHSRCLAFAIKLPCVCITPFGSPVVPPV